MLDTRHSKAWRLLSLASCLCIGSNVSAALLNLPDTPIFIGGADPALVQLVMERDNKLFFEAYPSYEDINGDGVLDTRYKPTEIDYFGYFDSNFCYTHTGSYFKASSVTADKKCTENSSSWSGDFLNYTSMTRMDLIRAALYGGNRLIDTSSQTILRRAFVPWANHTWGIEYESETVDGYKISDYSSLSEPQSGRRHHLATNNFPQKNDVPYLRIRRNSKNRIWNWVDTETPQGAGSADQDLILDVEVCAAPFLEGNCKQYPSGIHKPTGILHEYGEDDSMYFSLITGSFENNIQGGVLRKSMESFTNEISSSNGIFNSSDGIVQTLDAIQIPNDFKNVTTFRDCDFLKTRPMQNGECSAWGNPVAEMMYEGLRYLSGAKTPTSSFHNATTASSSMDSKLGLTTAAWDDPFSDTQPYGQCSSAYQLVISDPSPSYDGDQLPGSYFSSFSDSTLGALDVGSIADLISDEEGELPGLKFIGEADGLADRSPSAKTVSTFKTARGQAPEAPHREGSFYASSVAYYGHRNDINASAAGSQNVGNFILALGSPLPTIEVEVGDRQIQIAPFGRTVGGRGGFCSMDVDNFSPTNSIVGFVVEEVSDTSGSFRVSFEDMEQGADNDMDAIVRYTYEVIGNEVELTLTSIEAAGCFYQHLGYSISGTTQDGIYLVVRDADTDASKDVDYEFDVPPGETAGTENWDDGVALPLVSTIRFTPSTTPAAQTLRSPLWYAAKWGGFDDENGDGIPQTNEYDTDGDGGGDGDPDNFFNVTNPSLLVQTLGEVFDAITAQTASLTAASVSGTSLSSDSHIYESSFDTGKWYGELTARVINTDGTLGSSTEWDANEALSKTQPNDRNILTYKPSTGAGIAFRWPKDELAPTETELDIEQLVALSTNAQTSITDVLGSSRLGFVRGENVADFRSRSQLLGDIINSSATLIGPPSYYYPDDWGIDEPETDEPYSAFGAKYATRQRVVYVGANDGMLHAFNAGDLVNGNYTSGDGSEIFAYIPSPVFDNLSELADPDYSHKYFVDATPNTGDVFINDEWQTVLVGALGRGGQGIYALNVTDVDSISEKNAKDVVLWEFTDEDDSHLGYNYTSPLIVRMNNGKWVAVFGNGYNATEGDGFTAPDGKAAIYFVDIETGNLITKLFTSAGSTANPNGINTPTAVDLDNDDIVDYIYTADLLGNVSKFNVTSSNSASWARMGDTLFTTDDDAGGTQPVTTQLAVASHPTGKGVMVYLGTGQYLESSDQYNDGSLHRIYALWDEDPSKSTNLDNSFPGDFLEQSINKELMLSYDTDNDNVDDASAIIRESSRKEIDWSQHAGWYMDLQLGSTLTGEKVIASPVLREGLLLVSTFVPSDDMCGTESSGWLMLLDAASGAMPDSSIDLTGDGEFGSDEELSGIYTLNNPYSPPTVVSAGEDDLILISESDGSGTSTTTLDSDSLSGRVNWRELQP